ncbi:MAG: TetR/AcrR family transcriptional regulator [Oligoflexia bacterium]|nr:TetR/AcrR family transcriptional regulator [Oligoflexia bacterium]
METSQTAQAILDEAMSLCQARGFNAFSYKDIARKLDIKTSSIHYHFPTKTDLGCALVERYSASIKAALENIQQKGSDPKMQLNEFVALMEGLAQKHRVCLCAMLASDLETLDPSLKHKVHAFFEDVQGWLEGRLLSGKQAGQFHFSKSASAVAHGFLATIQGMLMSARVFGSDSQFRAGKEWLLSSIARQ